MKKHIFAQLSLSLLIMSSLATSPVFAADKKTVAEKIEVTPISEDVTKEELAAIYVLSEICPSLIGKDLKFNKAYEQLVKAYLSNEDDAVDVLKKRANSKDFKAALKEARNDAKAASDDDNRQICDDVRNYYSK
jgi:peptidoglycan hydrolase CwlO-like protein